MLNALFPFIYITTLIVLLVQAFRMMRLGDVDQSNPSTDMPRRVDRTGLLTTHPELLDWLAAEFIARDWDLKWMIRQIVLSKTYRQSSQLQEVHRELDRAKLCPRVHSYHSTPSSALMNPLFSC